MKAIIKIKKIKITSYILLMFLSIFLVVSIFALSSCSLNITKTDIYVANQNIDRGDWWRFTISFNKDILTIDNQENKNHDFFDYREGWVSRKKIGGLLISQSDMENNNGCSFSIFDIHFKNAIVIVDATLYEHSLHANIR